MESNRNLSHEDDDDEQLTVPDDTLRPNSQVPGVSLNLSQSSNPDTQRLSQSLALRVNIRFKVKVADLLNRIGESGLEASGEMLAQEGEEPVIRRNGESESVASGEMLAQEGEEPVSRRNEESELVASGKMLAPEGEEPVIPGNGESELVASGEMLAPEGEEPVIPGNEESELLASGEMLAPKGEESVISRNGESELEASGKIPAPDVREPLNVLAKPGKGMRAKKRKSLPSSGTKKSSPSKTGVTKESFVVEKILDKRSRPEGEEYLLRWAGCTEEHDSWESPSHMQCDDLISEFSKQRELAIAARHSSDSKCQPNSCSHRQNTIDVAPNDQVLEIPFGPSSSVQVFAPQAKDDTNQTLKNENKSNRRDSDVNSTTSPTPFFLPDKEIGTETSSMKTRASSTSAIICSTIGLFPYIDLSSINHESPPSLIPSTIVSTRIGHDGHRWFLVNWENYLYPFAWVREEFIKRHFIELVIKFYERMIYK